jgi:hypothetical protein
MTSGISELPLGPVEPMVLLADCETGIARELRELEEAYRPCHAMRSRVPISIIGARMRQCVVVQVAEAS